MQIQATKKLLDKLPFDIIDAGDENPLYDWHANLLTINRRNTVVLMNDLTRYAIVLHGMKAKDFKRFDVLVKEAIRDVFQKEHFSAEVINKYLDNIGAVTFHKTKSRSLVTQLTMAMDYAWAYADELNPTKIINSRISKRLNQTLAKGSYPYENMKKELAVLVDNDLFQVNIAHMKVTLNIGEHLVWRSLAIPLDLTFEEFHEVLQIVFNWQNSHLHEFHFYDSKSGNQMMQGEKIGLKTKIVMDEEMLHYDHEGVEVELEDEFILADFIPKHRYFKYIYDFGDSWQHEIVVEDVRLGQGREVPKCLAWAEIAPPEDCGGEYGFHEFLTIINDEQHPDYRAMIIWGESQGYKPVDLQRINNKLQHM